MTEKRISGYNNNLEEIYSFLAIFYLQEPNFVLMTALLEKNIVFLQEILKGTDLYKQLELSYSEWLASPRFRRIIKEEYIRLFKNPMFSSLLPYETCNHNSNSLAKQYSRRDELLCEIISFYNSDDGDFIPNSGEVADHISSELTFAAKIVGKEMKAVKSGDEVQVDNYAHLRCSFLANHMLVWLPNFCKDVNKKTRTAFYRTVTDITIYIVKMDYDNLQARFRSEQTAEGCC